MTYKNVGLKDSTFKMIEECRKEFLNHHPELRNIPISNDKVLYETMRFYLGIKN